MIQISPILKHPKSPLRNAKCLNAKRQTPSVPWLDRVKAATLNYPRDQRHLVGVSGGVDSRVLLHLLPMLGFRDLVVCHLNHNLRGVESLEDSKFVRRLTRRLGLPLRIDTLTELPGIGSLEAAAREARLHFFAQAAEHFSTSSVLLAHHADDQIETFLFNLFRGTGSLDNAAIKGESEVKVGSQTLLIRRPLLEVWKEEIREFATAFRLRFRDDSTNLSRQMVRNRVRHDLILAANESEFLRSLVPEMQGQPELDVRELRKLPVAIQRRTIHAWLRNHNLQDCGFDEIEGVRSLLNRVQIAKINLPRGLFCRRRAGRLFLQFPRDEGPKTER
jgi:tRNA(Ile)-lysidine synthase